MAVSVSPADLQSDSHTPESRLEMKRRKKTPDYFSEELTGIAATAPPVLHLLFHLHGQSAERVH